MAARDRHIRPATAADVEAMVGLLNALFSIEADFQPDPARQRRGLRMLLSAQTACVLVAEMDGEVAGMCTCQLVVSTAEGGFSGLVEDVVVADSRRGGGIGRALLDAATAWAVERGATRLQLLADADNAPACAFYSHIGWTGTRLVCLRRVP
ncbi:MAG: N-acetyltransferase family protein [Desulfovibrionaceae bacterium]